MFDIEIIRLCFVIGLLAINSFADFKYRTIFGSDKIYASLGIAGFTLLMFDSFFADDVMWALFMAVINITFVLFFWRIKMLASGDVLVMLLISVTMPVWNDWVLVVPASLITAYIISGISGLFYNLFLNFETLFRHESLFEKYSASIIKKIITFGIAHKRRCWEKHTISIEKGTGFSLTSSPYDKEFSKIDGQLVSPAIPLIPFVLISFGLILLFF
ncbi:MAG: hypothetical protein HRU07_05770 [Nitrosopumilus sp.]|nr:hypothetical protein [Nitrosopumilus sp.]NRA05654.1 hypothetical protein [Nitrosopumilus sp.]